MQINEKHSATVRLDQAQVKLMLLGYMDQLDGYLANPSAIVDIERDGEAFDFIITVKEETIHGPL